MESDAQIRTKILQSITDYIKPKFIIATQNLSNVLPGIVANAIRSQPEYQSLLNGALKFELGVPDAANRVSSIIDIWSSNIRVNYGNIKQTGIGLSATFSVDMIKEDYSDILSSEAAIVTDQLSGIVIPWLQWLLLDGGKILVKNYSVKFGPNNRSRTQYAIMVESDQNWRVPPEFAGTQKNNWITRSLENVNDEIINLMIQELERVL
jgi:hypothetical protein